MTQHGENRIRCTQNESDRSQTLGPRTPLIWFTDAIPQGCWRKQPITLTIVPDPIGCVTAIIRKLLIKLNLSANAKLCFKLPDSLVQFFFRHAFERTSTGCFQTFGQSFPSALFTFSA